MDKELLDAIFDECVFDLCELEGKNEQNEVRCKALENFNKECLALSEKLNIETTFDWRNEANCGN